MANKSNDPNSTALPTRRDSIRLLAGGAVCLAVDTSVLAQAAGAVPTAQTGAGQAVGHEDAAVALANSASANPWSLHDTPAMVAAALAGLPPIPAEMLGHAGALVFTQDASGLRVKMPGKRPCDFAWALKISGLKLVARV